jgi:hypothetical protein
MSPDGVTVNGVIDVGRSDVVIREDDVIASSSSPCTAHVTLAEGNPDWLAGSRHAQLTSLPSGTVAGQVGLTGETLPGFAVKKKDRINQSRLMYTSTTYLHGISNLK